MPSPPRIPRNSYLLSQSHACMAVHVGIVSRDLRRAQMVGLVDSSRQTTCQRGSLNCISAGLARHGRGGFPRPTQSTGPTTPAGMALGDGEDCVGYCAALGDRSSHSGRTIPAPRMDGPFRSDLSSALRQLPFDCALLAGQWHRCAADHGEPDSLENPERVLGKALEPGVPATCPRVRLQAFAEAHRSERSRIARVCCIRADSRSGHLSPGARRIWTADRVFHRSRPRDSVRAIGACPAHRTAEETARQDLRAGRNGHSCFLVVSSRIRTARDHSFFQATHAL